MPLGAERQEGWEDRTHNLKPCPQVQLERCLQAPSELLVPQPQVGGVCVWGVGVAGRQTSVHTMLSVF